MPDAWIYALASVTIISLVSLIGIFFIPIDERRGKTAILILVSLAVGGLLGDAFIHLLPEAYLEGDPTQVSLLVLLGILGFFSLEKFLSWRHEHSAEQVHEIGLHHHPHAIKPVGYMNLLADAVHNLIDGLLIRAAYLVSIPVGVATTAAVLLHEIPQEIGDFGVLLHAGFSRKRALLFNLFSASLAIAGAIVALLIGGRTEAFSVLMLPITAGGFIYIAGSDLVPELHKEISPMKSLLQIASIVGGLLIMLLLARFG